MICLRGCKRVIAQQDAELKFLREFVRSMRTVHREPTAPVPAVDLSLVPEPEVDDDGDEEDDTSSFYADRDVAPRGVKKVE